MSHQKSWSLTWTLVSEVVAECCLRIFRGSFVNCTCRDLHSQCKFASGPMPWAEGLRFMQE